MVVDTLDFHLKFIIKFYKISDLNCILYYLLSNIINYFIKQYKSVIIFCVQ